MLIEENPVGLKRLIATLTLTAATVLATSSIASPAQALPPGELYDYFPSLAECAAVGDAGDGDSWSQSACTSAFAPPGMWALYVVYY